MIIPSGFAQVNLMFTGSNVPTGAEMTFGVDHSGYSGTPVQAGEDIADIFDGADLEGLMNTSIALTGVLVKYGPNSTGPSGLFTASINGTGSSDGMSSNVAYLIHKNTALGGRAGRGRMFMPGVQEGEVDHQGDVDPTFLGLLNTRWSTFGANMAIADLPLVLLHAAGSPISTPTVVTSLTVDARVATQRRRLRR